MSAPGAAPGPADDPAPLRRRAVGLARLCLAAGWWPTVAYAGLALLTGAVPATVAWLTKLVIDAVAAPVRPPPASLAPLLGGLVAAGLVSAAAPHATRYLQGELDRRVDLLAHDRLYTSVDRFSGLSRFEDPAFLDRLRMAQQATSAVSPGMLETFGIARGLVTLTSLLGVLLVLNPLMAGVVVAAAVPALVAEVRLSRRRVRLLAATSPAVRRRIFYAELLTDHRAVKETRLFGLGAFLRHRMLTELRSVSIRQRDLSRRELRVQTGLAALSAAVAGGGLAWAVLTAAGGRLTVGDISLFVAAVAGVQSALTATVGQLAAAHEALDLYGYFDGVVAEPDDLPAPAEPARVPPLRRGIELRDVWFRYGPDRPWVLRGVTLVLPHGTTTALVGLNGAGKTTLVKLLCRFYDPDRGTILWDGVDIRRFTPAELRRRLGVLFQDYMCYDLTAAENIGAGDLDRLGDRPRLEQAARLADVHEALTRLPQGYDTMLSRIFTGDPDEDGAVAGVVLSGGQWQRLALARAFLRDRRDLMLLDEPSAGLDPEAEAVLHRRSRSHRAGCTTVLISHRLNLVRDADRIAVLVAGRVTELGSHHDLIAAGGDYARLFDLQATGYRDDPAATGPPAGPPAVDNRHATRPSTRSAG